MKRFCIAFILLSSVPQTTSPQQPDQAVVKVGVNEVLVDVVVTDRKGKQIRDIRPEEFEIYEDGRLQKIVSLTMPESEVEAPAPAAHAAPARTSPTGGAAASAAARRMGGSWRWFSTGFRPPAGSLRRTPRSSTSGNSAPRTTSASWRLTASCEC